jgi:hypothetical protein
MVSDFFDDRPDRRCCCCLFYTGSPEIRCLGMMKWQQVLLSWVTYYGACLAALERKHIGVDSVLLMLPTKFRMIGVVVAEAVCHWLFCLDGMGWISSCDDP